MLTAECTRQENSFRFPKVNIVNTRPHTHVCMYVCIHACIRMHIRTYIHTYDLSDFYIYIFTHIYIYYVYVYVHIRLCGHLEAVCTRILPLGERIWVSFSQTAKLRMSKIYQLSTWLEHHVDIISCLPTASETPVHGNLHNGCPQNKGRLHNLLGYHSLRTVRILTPIPFLRTL